MLTLVVADRYLVCVVQDDVGDLEHGVVEQPRADGFLSLALLLELRHPAQLSDRRDTVQQPRQFGVRAYVALNDQDAPGGVEPGSHEEQRGTACAAGELGRGGGERHGVEVDDAVDGVVPRLVVHPAPDRPDVVAQMHLAGRLDPGENARHGVAGYLRPLSRPRALRGARGSLGYAERGSGGFADRHAKPELATATEGEHVVR